MIKRMLAFGILLSGLGLFLGDLGMQEVQASSLSYWQRYAAKNYPNYNYKRYSRPTYRTRSTNLYSRNYQKSSRSSNSATRNYYSRSNYRTTPRNNSQSYQKTTIDKGLTAYITPKTQSKYVYKITNDPIDLFTIGIKNSATYNSSTFNEAVNVQEMNFRITDAKGIPSDLSKLALVVNNQDFTFDRNGYLTLDFGNLRLASGEGQEVEVKVKVEDPDLFPRFSGRFRVKLLGIKAQKESSSASVPLKISGKTISDYIVLNPSTDSTTSGTAQITPQSIYGRNLTAGEKTFVMGLNLHAYADDFILEDITVRNTFGNNADALVNKINLWDLTSSRLLGTRKFIGGAAKFSLSRNARVSIPRNGKLNLGFEVVVNDPIPSNISDNRLSLTVSNSDIVLYGYGSGQPVPNSRKNISFDQQTFTITQGGVPSNGGISFSSTQPELVVGAGLSEVARFKIGSSGGTSSIGRISLATVLNNLQFPGGLSLDDVALREVYQNRTTNSNLFTPISAAGNTIVFDANSEVYIERNQTREFSLLLSLQNAGASNDNDSVSVRILGDGASNKGTLASVRASGANFVWSDHSGRPHVAGSFDWFSGYLLGGLPTNYYVNRRQ